MATVLVVDDDRSIAEVLERYLDAAGFSAVCVYDGTQALEVATAAPPDLALLDVTLPGMDGLELTRRFCARGIPVILVTARQDSVDRLVGLELGADDYITKPFSPREVVARVKNVLRRSLRPAVDSSEILTAGDLTIDAARRAVRLNGAAVNLTPVEFEIVLALAKRSGAVCSRRQLLDAASGGMPVAHEKTVDAHVKNIRRKLGIDASRPSYIRTVKGIGHKL